MRISDQILLEKPVSKMTPIEKVRASLLGDARLNEEPELLRMCREYETSKGVRLTPVQLLSNLANLFDD